MKRLMSIFMLICMIMAIGCFSASAADESASEDLSATDCISGVVIGDSVELTVTDADETIFEMHDEGDTDLSILPRVTVPNGCESCIKRITVWPAHYDSTDKTIRYLESMYAFYTWPEATSFGGTLGVPTTDTFNLMYAFGEKTNLVANAWRMKVDFNIYSDYYGSFPKYYEYTPSSNSVADKRPDGTIRFECNGRPGHQTVSLISNFSAPTDPSNQPALVLRGAFYYYDKTTKTTQNAMSFAQTLFNQ